ncbi:MAG: hypothetical protein RMK52_00755 [Chitinophagales bacterium]|nr:hypothetical protein [Chitinophagales bacterium]MDW8392754.1 hypothetical protein [Chitinophagales bacterium]
MSVLRFRVMYEEDESIYREVEILSSQSLRQFVDQVRSSFGIASHAEAQLFTGNDSWHKKQALPLEALGSQKGQAAKAALAEQPLVKFIFDPHQRFVFELSETGDQLLIELSSISEKIRDDVAYPHCVRSVGPSPFRKEEPVPVEVPQRNRQASDADEDEDEEADDDEQDLTNSDETEEEELIYEEEEDDVTSGDLMEGDAIEETDEDSGSADLGMDDEFFDEDFGEDSDLDDFEEDIR